MRRVIVTEYVSVDGVMQDPGGVGQIEHGGWTVPYWNDEIAKFQLLDARLYTGENRRLSLVRK